MVFDVSIAMSIWWFLQIYLSQTNILEGWTKERSYIFCVTYFDCLPKSSVGETKSCPSPSEILFCLPKYSLGRHPITIKYQLNGRVDAWCAQCSKKHPRRGACCNVHAEQIENIRRRLFSHYECQYAIVSFSDGKMSHITCVVYKNNDLRVPLGPTSDHFRGNSFCEQTIHRPIPVIISPFAHRNYLVNTRLS